MNCFMFPGLPLAAVVSFPDDDDFYEVAELVLRYGHHDLLTGAWPGAEGTQQMALQLQGLASSLYQLRKMAKIGIVPSLVAQHGLGIIPALVACNSVSEAAAVELSSALGECLASQGKGRERYALGEIAGLPLERVEELAAQHQVYLANHNTSLHFLLSGRQADIQHAVQQAQVLGAFSARSLHCDAPLHSPLLGPIEDALGKIIARFRYTEPVFPLINHLNQTYLGARDIPRFLLRGLQLPVYWERTYRAISAAGVGTCYEVGAGEALRRFNKWIDSNRGA